MGLPPLECRPQESKELTFPVHYYNPGAQNNNGYRAGTQIFIKRINTGYLALLYSNSVMYMLDLSYKKSTKKENLLLEFGISYQGSLNPLINMPS